jgi:uncharacterized protein (DUF2147 family)
MTWKWAILLVLLTVAPARAETGLTGLWLTQDHDGVMAITECGNGALCIDIAGFFLDHRSDPTPLDWRGHSQCHLPMVSDARETSPHLWFGHITDPRNGHTFGVEIHLDQRGDLALRGYLGIPLLGETQTWTRYAGRAPDDCRIYPPEQVIGQSH